MLLQLMINNSDVLLNYPTTKQILLMQDAMYIKPEVLSMHTNKSFYALKSDWLAAGLPDNHTVQLISTKQWVSLCAEHPPVLTIQK